MIVARAVIRTIDFYRLNGYPLSFDSMKNAALLVLLSFAVCGCERWHHEVAEPKADPNPVKYTFSFPPGTSGHKTADGAKTPRGGMPLVVGNSYARGNPE